MTTAPGRPTALAKLRGRANLRRTRLCVLVATDGYHVQGEVVRALRALGHYAVPVDCGRQFSGVDPAKQVLAAMLAAIAREAPDLLISVNYIGFDRVGWLDQVLVELELPCAIWLVDSPLFFAMGLLRHRAPRTRLFAWDRTHAAQMARWTGQPVHHLPLACEPERFAAAAAAPADAALGLSFVGSSLVPLSAKWRGRLSAEEATTGEAMAERLQADRHALHALVPTPGPPIDRQVLMAAYANCVGSRALRRGLLRALPQDQLCCFGDAAWREELPHAHVFEQVGYGQQLGEVYRRSAINVNATILQMPTAVNQRVFDVPAAGGFVVTDAQSELFELFERDEEVVAYRTPDELVAACAYYRTRPKERAARSEAALRRIRQEHTYRHRLTALLATMRQCVGQSLPSVPASSIALPGDSAHMGRGSHGAPQTRSLAHLRP